MKLAAAFALVALALQPIPAMAELPPDPMLQLSADPSFHFEILRTMAMTAYEGADLGEILVAAPQIVPGDFESF